MSGKTGLAAVFIDLNDLRLSGSRYIIVVLYSKGAILTSTLKLLS